MKQNSYFGLLTALALTQFIHIVDFMLLMPLGPKIMREFAVTPREYGFLISAYTFSAAPAGLLSAFFLDKFDRKKSLITTTLFFGVATAACGFASSFWPMLLGRVFAGAFGGIIAAQVFTIITDAAPEHKRASAMGVIMASFSIASIAGVPLSLWIADQCHWSWSFWSIAIATLPALLLQHLFVPHLKSYIGKTRKAWAPFQNALTNPNQRKALLLMVFLMFGQFSVIPFIAPFLVKNAGFPEDTLPFLYMLGGLATAFTTPLLGRWSDRYGYHKVFYRVVPLSLIPLGIITHIGQTPIPIILCITALFMIFLSGRMVPSIAIISSTPKPEDRGSFMSINSAVQMMASGLATVIASSILVEENGIFLHYEWVGYFAMAASLIALWIGSRIK